MALIMYLNRTPSYEGVTIRDIKLMDSYFRWKHINENNANSNYNSFEKWCGHSESELPNKTIIDYFKPFWVEKNTYVEIAGEMKTCSVIDHMGRFVKSNPIFNWFYVNVLNEKIDGDYHQVTKEQLEELLALCNKASEGIDLVKEYNKDVPLYNDYVVNEDLASKLLPTRMDKGILFGPAGYDSFYGGQIITAINVITNILNTTDFDKQDVYINFLA